MSVLLAPFLIAGLVHLLRHRARALGYAYLAMLVLTIATGGKAYYAAGLLTVLTAAAGVVADGWLGRGRVRLRTALTGVAVGVGWPEFRDAVRAAVRTLPPEQRGRAVVFSSNYSEAGAVILGRDLPPAYSGQNGFAFWPPPATATGPVILTGFDPGDPALRYFTGCRVPGRVDNGYGRLDRGLAVPDPLRLSQARPATMSIRRVRTRPGSSRSPLCSYSLVTQARVRPTARAVSSDSSASTYMSSK